MAHHLFSSIKHAIRRQLPSSALGRRLLAAILVCSTALAVLATGIQLFTEYERDISDIDVRISHIERSSLESLAIAAWNFDTSQIHTQLDGIAHLPDIHFVQLVNAKGEVVDEAGTNPQGHRTLTRQMPVFFFKDQAKTEKIVLGTLTVTASMHSIFERLARKAAVILFTQILKTLAASVFILVIFHRLVSRHLSALADYARKWSLDSAGQSFSLPRKRRSAESLDEIDVLVAVFNDMSRSIQRDVQALKDTKLELSESQERYRGLVEKLSVVPWSADAESWTFTYVGPQAGALLGVPVDQWVKPGFWFDVLHPDDSARAQALLRQHPRQAFELECRLRRPEGTHHWVSVQATWHADTQGTAFLQGYLLDIHTRKLNELELQNYQGHLEELVSSRTHELGKKVAELREVVRKLNVEIQDRERAEKTLREGEERYRQLVEMSPDAILIERDQKIAFVNGGALRLFGAARPEQLLGRALTDFLPAKLNAYVEARLVATDSSGEQDLRPLEGKAQRLDGSEVDVEISKAIFQYGDQVAVQTVVHDISKHKEYEEQLRRQAHHDALTGLPNRVLLMDRLEQALRRAERDQQMVVVLCVDLDRFKYVNDSLGHEIGDELLKTAAQRMLGCIRKGDTLARLGGDEFVVLLEAGMAQEDVSTLAQRMLTTVSQPLMLKGHEISVTCSVGCSAYPQDGRDASALLKHADAAMYRAKDQGRNNMQRYKSEMHLRANEQLLLESRLRRALERQEFLLHYQPQVDLKTGHIVGVEALIRWQHSELGMVPPARFIPLAEETGLIVQIGEWVIQTACAQAQAWQSAGLPAVRMAVNLSAQQLARADLEPIIERALSDSGIAPQWLELELTESASMTDPQRTIQLLSRFRAMGMSVAIDDFGTGYSNLAYLKRFPANRLKLDRSFVRDLTHDPDDAAIASAIIGMAHSLRLPVVAEGVEQPGQLAHLLAWGCDEMQGYFFSPPVAPDVCAKMFLERRTLDLNVPPPPVIAKPHLRIVAADAGSA